MINNVALVGRLTKDVEVKYTQNGKATTRFNLAVNRMYKDQNGEYQADFISVQCWGKQAEFLQQYTHKGAMIALSGRIETSNYTDKNGNQVYSTYVVADRVQSLERRNNDGMQQQNFQNGTDFQSNKTAAQAHTDWQVQNSNFSQNTNINEMNQVPIDNSDLPF